MTSKHWILDRQGREIGYIQRVGKEEFLTYHKPTDISDIWSFDTILDAIDNLKLIHTDWLNDIDEEFQEVCKQRLEWGLGTSSKSSF